MHKLEILIIGCGRKRDLQLGVGGAPADCHITTLDINPDVEPDVVWDLEVRPLPFTANTFDLIEAAEVLEHIGKQGDYLGFFAEFREYFRILKPNGLFCATVPAWDSLWALGDPGHRRVINDGTVVFLSKTQYEMQQAENRPMTDYRYLLGAADFKIEQSYYEKTSFIFALRAIKL